MSASQPPTGAPFGLEPNIAAGLAYLLGLIGGIIFLVGGGTNKFVKWSAAQSITLWGGYIVLIFALQILIGITHLWILFPIFPILGLLAFVAWIWTTISGFSGKEVRVPVVAGITESIFKAQL